MSKETDQLDEVKATGEDSSTMDPVTPAGGSPKGKNRKADKNVSVDPKADNIEDDVKTPTASAVDKKSPARKADKAAMKESIGEMFEGQDLSEDFKARATVIFEAVVNDRINQEVEALEEEFATKLEEQATIAVTELTEKLDTYLDYVTEKWMKENALAVDQGIKAEIAESFMSGLFDLYMEHNVNVPAESENILESMANDIEKMETRLNESIEENISLKRELSEAHKADVYDAVCEGLTETQAEKLVRLAEGIDFEDIEDFAEKVGYIKENYFGKTNSDVLTEESGDDIDPIEDHVSEVKHSDPAINRYAEAISQSLRK